MNKKPNRTKRKKHKRSGRVIIIKPQINITTFNGTTVERPAEYQDRGMGMGGSFDY